MTRLLHRLGDPTDLVFGAVSAVAFAALTLPDPDRLGPPGRHALRLGTAAVTAWWAAAGSGRGALPLVPLGAAVAPAAAAAALALAPLEERTDRWLIDRLRSSGMRRPRAALAAGAAAVALASVAVERRIDRDLDGGSLLDDVDGTTRPLDPRLRTLLRAMLLAHPGDAADRLAGQLERAEEMAWVEGVSSHVPLVVPDDVARVVPHTQQWPASLRWRTGGGLPVELWLQVHQGRLDHASVLPAEEEHIEPVDGTGGPPGSLVGGTASGTEHQEDLEAELDGWPDLGDVVLVVDREDGTRGPLANQGTPAGG